MMNKHTFDVSPDKSLGQNFFINKHLAQKISKEIAKEYPDHIFEIGPGTGVFTQQLQKLAPITAIEIADEPYKILTTSLQLPYSQIIKGDILALTEAEFNTFTDNSKRTIIFGSLPYNKSKKIISKLLQWKRTKALYFIIQKEVAQKYTSTIPSNKLSILSDIYSTKKRLFDIGPSNFRPKPKVNSTLIRFEKRSEQLLQDHTVPKFRKLLEQSFRSPRKKLSNNLDKKRLDIINKDDKLLHFLDLRPEQLSTVDYIEIYKKITAR